MGRFSDGLFHREVDFESYYEFFDDEIVKPLKKDVIRLRRKAWERDQLNKKSGEGKNGTEVGPSQTGKKPSKKELEEDWELDVGFYRPRFPRLVRDYLNSGVLASLIRMHGPEQEDSEWFDFFGHKNLALIAFCAMELGCTLPPGFLARLKSNYRHVCRFETEREQMRQACDEYVDGKPYHFVSVWLEADKTGDSSTDSDTEEPETQPPGLEPIPPHKTPTNIGQPARKRRKVGKKAAPAPIVEEYCLRFPPNTCANCGATRGHGTPDLKRCKGCKTTLYCFEGCQKWHWFHHRLQCEADQEAEESSKGKSIDKGENVPEEEVEEATA